MSLVLQEASVQSQLTICVNHVPTATSHQGATAGLERDGLQLTDFCADMQYSLLVLGYLSSALDIADVAMCCSADSDQEGSDSCSANNVLRKLVPVSDGTLVKEINHEAIHQCKRRIMASIHPDKAGGSVQLSSAFNARFDQLKQCKRSAYEAEMAAGDCVLTAAKVSQRLNSKVCTVV